MCTEETCNPMNKKKPSLAAGWQRRTEEDREERRLLQLRMDGAVEGLKSPATTGRGSDRAVETATVRCFTMDDTAARDSSSIAVVSCSKLHK